MKKSLAYLLAAVVTLQISIISFVVAHESVAGSGRELALALEGTFFLMVAFVLIGAAAKFGEKRE